MSSFAEVVLIKSRGLCWVTSSHLCWSAGGRRRRDLYRLLDRAMLGGREKSYSAGHSSQWLLEP